MDNYYNTNNENGGDLLSSEKKVRKQNNLILSWFLSNPDKEYSAEDLNNIEIFRRYYRTSIRRALTDLEKDGKIMFVRQKKSFDTGKKIGVYQLRTNTDTSTQAPPKPVASKKTLVEILNLCKTGMNNAINDKSSIISLSTECEFLDIIEKINKALNYDKKDN